MSLRYIRLASVLLLQSFVAAQQNCTGDTSVYANTGLNVSFVNFCGSDIHANAGEYEKRYELTWSGCMERCVQRAPICYGFSWAVPINRATNCVLSNVSFSDKAVYPETYPNDAAMLSSGFLSGLDKDCISLGLLGCFQKNGRLGTGPARIQWLSSSLSSMQSSTQSSTQSVTPTSTSTPSPTGQTSSPVPVESKGLSTGAKVGIGVGAAIVALLAIIVGVLLFLKHRRRRQSAVSPHPTAPNHPPVPQYGAGQDTKSPYVERGHGVGHQPVYNQWQRHDLPEYAGSG